ncbi:hypothetical protein [Scytonema sp. NUACC21]
MCCVGWVGSGNQQLDEMLGFVPQPNLHNNKERSFIIGYYKGQMTKDKGRSN